MDHSPLRASLVAAAMLAAGLGTTVGTGTAAADPMTERPAAGCQQVIDDVGDAHPTNNDEVPYDADLDIVSLTLRTTPTDLFAYVKVADLATGPASTDGHRYSVDFTFNGHVFALSGSSYKNGTGVIRDTLAKSGQAGAVTQLGVDVPSLTKVPPATDKGFKVSGLVVTWDVPGNWIVMKLPIADIEKYGAAKFTGKITDIDVRSTTDNYAVGTIADTTNANNSQTTDPKVAWTVGDNKCFTVATKLLLTVAKAGALRTVTAKLTTAAGQAVAAKPVVFYVNGKKTATVTTSAAGTAVLKNVKPGALVKAQFTAAPGFLGSSASKKV